MRDFFTVFRTNFKLCWSEPVTVAIMTLFPVLLIFVLSNALGGYITPDYSFDPAPVAAVTEDGGSLYEFLQGEGISRFLDVTFTDEATTRLLLEDGSASLAVIDKDGLISAIKPSPEAPDTAIAMAVIDSYNQISTAMTMAMMGGGDLSELMATVSADVSVKTAPLGNRVPNSADYYSTTMLVMILMFSGLNGLDVFKRGLLSETGNRILISPISKPSLVGGLIASSTATSYIQGLITFLFSTFVYGAYWGENIPLILLTLLGITLFSQALAIFFLLLVKNANAAIGVTQAVIWTSTFVADGYTDIDFGTAEKAFQYVPNALAHTVIFGSAFGGDESKIAFSLGLIFIYGAAFFIIAFLLGKRRLST